MSLKAFPLMIALDPLTQMTPFFLSLAATPSSAQTIGALYTFSVGGDPHNNETFRAWQNSLTKILLSSYMALRVCVF